VFRHSCVNFSDIASLASDRVAKYRSVDALRAQIPRRSPQRIMCGRDHPVFDKIKSRITWFRRFVKFAS
jgi:hypothetical protein